MESGFPVDAANHRLAFQVNDFRVDRAELRHAIGDRLDQFLGIAGSLRMTRGGRIAMISRFFKIRPVESQLPNCAPERAELEILASPVGQRGRLTRLGVLPFSV